MKRLIEINSAANYGSTGRIAEAIGLKAVGEGWECTMVHGPRYANSSGLNGICTQSKWGDRLHGVRSLLLDGHGLGSVRATNRLVAQLDYCQPDIVHLHNIHGYYINYKILFEWLHRADCKVVWTLHDCWPFTGHCTHFDFEGCYRWQSGCSDCPQIGAYPRSLYLDRSKRNYELKRSLFGALGDRLTLVAVSHWLEGLVSDSFLGCSAVTTIYNGIDLSVFSPRRSEHQRNYVIGVASPWTARKGLGDFMRLRNELRSDVDIVLVGLTANQVKKLPLGIIGIERTQNVEQLAQLYSGASVFVNPTYEDNFPTTNLEALACGTPVVTYRTGGSPEAIDENTGIVVEKGDVEGLNSGITQIWQSKDQFTSQQCRTRAEECFDKDKCFSKYIELYNRLIEK